MSADSATDAWAVGSGPGDTSAGKAYSTLAAHWDGVTWSPVNCPDPGPSGSTLTAVTALSPTDAWAVGYLAHAIRGGVLPGQTLILHWDGIAWSRVASPGPAGFGGALTGVSAVSPRDVWAVGYQLDSGHEPASTLTLHWDGDSWSRVASPDPVPRGLARLNALTAVSARTPSDVWAAGYTGNFDRRYQTHSLLLHWDGDAWSRVSAPAEDLATLAGVSADAPADAAAVGQFYSNSHQESRTLALHWNGGTWSKISTPNPGRVGVYPPGAYNQLSGVTALSPADGWAVGSYGVGSPSSPFYAVILHWNGMTWSRTSVPSLHPGTGNSELKAVTALSPADAWAVGDYGHIGAGRGLILHWDGTTWSKT